MPRIAIIGGGISGLSAAFTLEEKRQSGAEIEYVLFEAAPRLGGVMVTDRAVLAPVLSSYAGHGDDAHGEP